MSIGASRQVGHFNNAIHHHDGCRLVHPAMYDTEQFRFAFMTDVDLCIPPCWSFGISIQFKMSRIYQFVYNSINYSHAINCQTFQISHFQIHMPFRNIISKIYSFHILISGLFSKLLNTRNMNIITVNKELTKVVGSHFSFFDLGPRLGDLHQPLVKHKYTTF